MMPPNQSLAAAAPPPPAPPAPPTFGAGLRALFSGFGFILGTPGIWPLALVPVAAAALVTSLLGWGAISYVPDQVQHLVGARLGGVLSTVLQVLATVLALIVAAILGLALAQPLSGPALERIVRHVEQSLGAPAWPPTSVITDVLRSLQSMLIPYAVGLPILAILFVINLLFPPAVVITFPMKMLVTAIMIAWDLGDYPLSIRGVPVSERVSFIARHGKAMAGFGLGLALLGLIPCLTVLILPAGVAGAARLIVQIERWEAAQGRPPLPARQ